MSRQRSLSRRAAAGGFSLMEMIIALVMMVVVLLGALALLDATNRVTRVQLGRAEIQQAVRVAQDEMIRHVRMAGRGGLLATHTTKPMPTGVAISIENNVGGGRNLFDGVTTTPEVVEGTDILTIRGIFDEPLYYVDFLDRARFTIDKTGNVGTLEILATTPTGNFAQDLEILDDMRIAAKNDAVVMVSPFDESIYGVGIVDWGSSSYDSGNGIFTLAFQFEDDASAITPNNPTSRVHAASVLSSGGAYAASIFERAGFKTVGILSEYRYFVRDGDAYDGATVGIGSQFAPRLSRARTEVNWNAYRKDDAGDPDYEDISNYILDLQVAVGFSDGDPLSATQGAITETADGTGDQWFLNAAGESVPAGDATLFRVTSLGRSEQAERGYRAIPILRLEDRTYGTSGANTDEQLRYQRFFLETVIDLRNL